MIRFPLLLALLLVATGCGTADPLRNRRPTATRATGPQPARAQPATVTSTVTSTVTRTPSAVTSDPGSRILPYEPVGALAVETEPGPPPGSPPPGPVPPPANPSEDDLGRPPTEPGPSPGVR